MNIDQLRRQAKELRDAARRGDPHALQRITAVAPGLNETVSLAVAQLVLAREHGFASWPRLKAAADINTPDLARFLDVSLHGPATTATAMLAEHPTLGEDPYAAAVLGDADRAVGAVSVVDERGWPPLLYACYSRWHQFEPTRSAGLTDTVARLLDAGANTNSHNGRLPNQGYQSALLGAVTTDKPDVVALLLARGAQADDRVSLHTAAELRHHHCLQLLVEAGARIERTWALGAAVFARDPWAVQLLLDAITRAGGDAAARASEQLEDAAREGSVELIKALLAYGADAAGRSELVRDAVRAGGADAATLLQAHGGDADVTVVDRLIGACMRADRAEAERLTKSDDFQTTVLTDDDRAFLVHVASRAPATSVELMLDAGWPVDARNDTGETALHTAAYQGKIDTVRLLLARGAAVDARDDRFDATPLAFATVGSRERRHGADADGDWPSTARMLLDAGASRDAVWLTGDKAPSDDVAAVLRSHGVQPEPPDAPADEAQPPASTDTADSVEPAADDPLTEIAALLRIAFDTTDLDLFASLLAPDVRWGGGPLGCTSREHVIAQYRQVAELGFRGTIAAAEVGSEDTLIVELRYAGAAEGMPPAPPGLRVQVLRVIDELIVSIDGYPDLPSARHAVASR